MVSTDESIGRRILVADDEDLFLHSTADLLRDEGYSCDTVSNSEEGFRALRTSPYNLLIADINMPGNTDLEFVRRGRNCFPDLPIILVTGYPELDTAVGGIEINVSNYLMKPLESDALIREVHSVISESWDARPKNPSGPVALHGDSLPFHKRVVGPDGRILMISESFARLLGFSAHEIRNVQLADLSETPLFHPSQSDRGVFHSIVEKKFLKRNGETLNALVFRQHLPDDRQGNGAVEEYILDITEERRLGDLDSLDLTIETAGLIAGGVAHDLNNMLNVVDGYLLLSQEAVHSNHPTQEFFEESRKAIAKASRLTWELIEFSKSEQEEAFDPIDLDRLLSDLESLSQVRLGDKIEMAITRCEETPLVLGDQDALFDALFNLVMNAADALSSNRGVIHVYVDRISLERKIDRNSCSYDPTEYLRIEVIDNGSGIPEDLIAKVHQPFFTTKRGEGGNGLGLAIVFRTVKKAGGFVDIRSVLGLGTGVSVCLPISKDEYGELER